MARIKLEGHLVCVESDLTYKHLMLDGETLSWLIDSLETVKAKTYSPDTDYGHVRIVIEQVEANETQLVS